MEVCQSHTEPWNVTLVDTGINTMTGGRIKRIKNYVNETFCLTYGDGLSDVNILKTIDFHKKNKLIATVTTIQPPGRFGAVVIKRNKITHFMEKQPDDSFWINGGYFVFEPEIMDYIKEDSTVLEREPLQNLAKKGQLGAYKHTGFWHHVDTLIEKNRLNELWNSGNAPWKIW
jgi:glucose-1-phosphate cytidylyltransferase